MEAKDLAKEFVEHYPNMFTDSHWFWIQAITELLKKYEKSLKQ